MPEIYEPITSEIEKDGIRITLSGSCNMCGWCCEKMCTNNIMTDDCKCRYLKDVDAEGHRLCAIQEAIENDNDKFFENVTEEEMAYYLKYCECFPICLENDSRFDMTVEYLRKIGWPPPQCGYTMVKL